MKKIILLMLIIYSTSLTAQKKDNFSLYKTTKNTVDSVMNSYLNEINSDSIKNTIQFLQDFNSRFMLDTNHRRIAVSLQQKFKSIGYQQTVLDSFLTITYPNDPGSIYCDTTWQYNVIATLEGSVYPDSVCITGGHYDSYCDSVFFGKKAPGADDNASGVAATLEIARVFKKMNYHPALSIKFIAFAAEEMMYNETRSGASYYAEKAYLNGEKIKFFLNNDMIAYDSTFNNWHSNLYCFYGMDWIKELATSMCQLYTTIIPDTFNFNCPGDAFRFYQKGFQSLHLEEGIFNPYYHTGNDVVSNLNTLYSAEMTKITMAMLINAAGIYSGLNVNDLDSINSLIIYPNPATEKVYIQNKNKKDLNLQIFNSVGEIMLKDILKKDLNEINITSLKRGIYIIQLTGIDVIYQKKLIIN